MKNDMKLIMESWRKSALLEQAPQQVTGSVTAGSKEAEALQSEYPGFDFQQPYPQGSYGAFVYAESVASYLVKNKKKVNRESVMNAIKMVTTLGADFDSGEEKSLAGNIFKGIAGFTGIIAGIGAGVALSKVLAGAGAMAFAYSTWQTFTKNPKGAEKYPALKVFKFDEEWAKILDDDIEKEYAKEYMKFFETQVKTNPTDQMMTIDTWINNELKQDYNNRALTKTQPTP